MLTDCVPSKTLIATAELMTDVSTANELGVMIGEDGVNVDLGKVNRRVLQLAADQSADIARRLEREGVQVVQGRGRLDGPGRVVVGEESYDADAVLIATGAAPRTLPSAQPDGERILTWEQVYDLTELPTSLIVVGSGVTGAEFASAYLALGRAGHAGVVARPGAAGRGRRRLDGARGGLAAPRHERALQVADGVGDPLRRHRHGGAHRRPHRRGLALHPGARLGAQHRRPRASRRPAWS